MNEDRTSKDPDYEYEVAVLGAIAQNRLSMHKLLHALRLLAERAALDEGWTEAFNGYVREYLDAVDRSGEQMDKAIALMKQRWPVHE